ncbi:DNA polymerase x family protein, putative [Heliomicrobium modesticaldum Ice1]|uniref:DNA polymerase x family protein, putative n=1 Tax=Heliobacterium modesticaldum (strain ATCC 51547 / Ice1) TaxID=498761 RepID=B0TEW3_HELMI|nr:DNA polymerase/3'-5' exonuclease PolX [Heliomicrobium modesticaldum]ABZ84365.1 DNA polymerase x family protein, putative [Heliomicrobium modesticaldum Ice1]
MHNQEIAWTLAEMANLLEILGENPFKVSAIRKGAMVIEKLETPVSVLSARGQLAKIDGIGKGLCAEIEALLQAGESPRLQRLREKVPPGVLDMLQLPGIGLRAVRTFFAEGYTTLEELEEGARKHRLRQLPGIAAKTELAVIRGVELLRRRSGKFGLGVARPLAEALLRFLQNLPEVSRAELTGDLRRSQEMVEEIHLLAASQEPAVILNLVKKHPMAAKQLAEDDTFVRFAFAFGLPVRIEVTSESNFVARWVETTGTAQHWAALRSRGARPASCEEQADESDWRRFISSQEAEEVFYEELRLPWIPPELRETGKEVAQAEAGELPDLVELGDILGDFHIHTNWSDGVSSLEEMVSAGRDRGYAYMAITDHSQSLAVARGLSESKLREQQRTIRQIDAREKDITLFSGIEMDILGDGRLDYADDILREMDVVIASVHTGLRQERHKVHTRLEAALKNPHVDIIGHPTGRLIGTREPYDVDIDWLLDLAAKTGTILEINASPDRLDLSAPHARLAKERGVMIVINTDAHDRARLSEMAYGVANARRAGLEKGDILNTKPLAEVKKILAKPKG